MELNLNGVKKKATFELFKMAIASLIIVVGISLPFMIRTRWDMVNRYVEVFLTMVLVWVAAALATYLVAWRRRW